MSSRMLRSMARLFARHDALLIRELDKAPTQATRPSGQGVAALGRHRLV
jgi:hypothetical protein